MATFYSQNHLPRFRDRSTGLASLDGEEALMILDPIEGITEPVLTTRTPQLATNTTTRQSGETFPNVDSEGSSTGTSLTYKMRGFDTTLGQTVFWSASAPDPTGSSYGGPGPLTDVVIAEVIGS